MDGVGISIIGRPRPLSGHDTPNPAHNTYTPNYEEPGKCSPRSGSAWLRNSSHMTGSLRSVGAYADCVIEAGVPHPTYVRCAEAVVARAIDYEAAHVKLC